MRVALPVAITLLSLLGAACGGDSPSAHTPPTASGTSSHTATSASSSSRSTTVSVSFGTPFPATAAPHTSAPSAGTPVATVAAHTPTPAPPPGPCTAANLTLTTTTDATHYGAGQHVRVSVTARNVSAATCVFTTPGEFAIEGDPTGPAVFAVHLACAANGCQPLTPGSYTTFPIDWDQMANEGPTPNQQAAPGAYHARAAFTGFPASTSAAFTLGP